MQRCPFPWSGQSLDKDTPFTADHVLMSEEIGSEAHYEERVMLMAGKIKGQDHRLFLHPYPVRGRGLQPPREGFPHRPKLGTEPQPGEDALPFETLRRMNEVVARIQELKEALDDPENVWPHLRDAWQRAEREEDPRMAEIVRQAREVTPALLDLEKRVRRVLRRTRELVPLNRVQEMDRASMVWLSRRPGRTIEERAGASQRIMATARHENFDTLENRVLRAYLQLAGAATREWQREHVRAQESNRYRMVKALGKLARRMDHDLQQLGIGVATAGITPNYVLMQDKSYRLVFEAWVLLLKRDKALDALWAWQAEAWTDFAVLAIVLALDELPQSELIAQSPMIWNGEAKTGRWFEQDRPLAVFWLKDMARVVEVQARPEAPSPLLTAARAHVGLRISDPAGNEMDRRVAVWTPHSMKELNLEDAAREAHDTLSKIKRIRSQLGTNDIMDAGLIMAPAHDHSIAVHLAEGGVSLHAISLGASGQLLREGIAALKVFASSDFTGDRK